MSKQLYSFILLIFAFKLILKAQPNVKIYNQQTDSGFVIIADNYEVYPISVELEFKVKNLNIIKGENILLAPKVTGSKIASLIKENDNKTIQFSYNYHIYTGNIFLTNYDTNFAYSLPYTTHTSFKLHQGYYGNFSHQNENALDFTMPVGTAIQAARGGIVIDVVDKNNEGCANRSCMEFNNYITILHNDGTYAKYVHIAHKSATVKVCDSIAQDEVIALSGNTGFSSGPHLHFEVNIPSKKNKNTVKTLFKINEGNELVYLEEGNFYSKIY